MIKLRLLSTPLKVIQILIETLNESKLSREYELIDAGANGTLDCESDKQIELEIMNIGKIIAELELLQNKYSQEQNQHQQNENG